MAHAAGCSAQILEQLESVAREYAFDEEKAATAAFQIALLLGYPAVRTLDFCFLHHFGR